ncbi:MAG TPA: hypothetical protein VLF64_01390 [Candidatus Saccharimonadales bacterium]|nr:hypothetical protein [Candidatus Saccharimonadales bacterium]
MAEQQNTSMYHVPASQEAVVVHSPEAPLTEVELAYQQAMESALDAHEADPADVDRRRIEGLLGESTIAATEIIAPSPEVSFNPRDTAHLVACGQRVIRMRDIERGEGTPTVGEAIASTQDLNKGDVTHAA